VLQENAHGFKRVSALALGPGQELLGFAWSTAEPNQTLHAEWNLARWIFERRGTGLPAGSTIHSSLEPCAMCAAMILSLFEEGETVRVSFLEPDRGPAARNTCLKPGTDLWKSAGRPVIEKTWRASS
jgi:tRNA(Arg) A34 adenosine deaminase TadA